MNATHIYNEDCLDTMGKLHEGSVDMILTSPPYADLRDYKGYKQGNINVNDVAHEAFRILKEGGVMVWVIGDKIKNGAENLQPFEHALIISEAGFNLYDTIIYHKDFRGFMGTPENMYYQNFEYMLVFSKGKIKTTNLICDRVSVSKTGGKNIRNKDGSITSKKGIIKVKPVGKRENIWRYEVGGAKSASDKIASEHPAIFPEQLAADHIKSWSNKGDIVYDPFLGSGTTSKMAYLLGRRFMGSEIAKEYCDIANRRLEQVMQQRTFNLEQKVCNDCQEATDDAILAEDGYSCQRCWKNN